jgi:hypothetical protein
MMKHVKNSLFEITKVEFVPGTNFARKIICKLCGDLVYEIRENPRDAELAIEVIRMTLHMELQHNVFVITDDCTDPKCGKKH